MTPYSAPERRLRESVPGTAKVCISTYRVQRPAKTETCTRECAAGPVQQVSLQRKLALRRQKEETYRISLCI